MLEWTRSTIVGLLQHTRLPLAVGPLYSLLEEERGSPHWQGYNLPHFLTAGYSSQSLMCFSVSTPCGVLDAVSSTVLLETHQRVEPRPGA
jgi:hypothetical protein